MFTLLVVWLLVGLAAIIVHSVVDTPVSHIRSNFLRRLYIVVYLLVGLPTFILILGIMAFLDGLEERNLTAAFSIFIHELSELGADIREAWHGQ